MGLLYNPQNRAWSSLGLQVPLARLYTFDSVATTTPKATYSDNGLTTSNGAYVAADSSGVFPPIFGAANEAYYMELRTAAGVVIDQFPFVTILGPDESSSFLKDLGANGRFSVRGEAGVVQVETGNAAGDDIGGSGRLGGWDGTQGDDLEIDYATTSFTGEVEFGGLTVDGSTKGNVEIVPVLDLDLSTADYFTKSISTNSTFTFSNATAATAQAFALELTISSAAVPTWPASVDYDGGINPSSGLGNGRHILGFLTFNGGTDWTMKIVAKAAA